MASSPLSKKTHACFALTRWYSHLGYALLCLVLAFQTIVIPSINTAIAIPNEVPHSHAPGHHDHHHHDHDSDHHDDHPIPGSEHGSEHEHHHEAERSGLEKCSNFTETLQPSPSFSRNYINLRSLLAIHQPHLVHLPKGKRPPRSVS